MPVEEIDNSRHPLKIGLSDAYYMDKTVSSGKENSHFWKIVNIALIARNLESWFLRDAF